MAHIKKILEKKIKLFQEIISPGNVVYYWFIVKYTILRKWILKLSNQETGSLFIQLYFCYWIVLLIHSTILSF